MSETNPYAPPVESERREPPRSSDTRIPFQHASLGQRFMGALVDGLVETVIVVVLVYLIPIGPKTITPTSLCGASFIFLAINGTLIAKRGQSVGKIVVGTRIVDEEGRLPGLGRGFVGRTLPFAAVAYFPFIVGEFGGSVSTVEAIEVVTALVAIVDALLIFGTHRQCLHDRIAGTYVAIAATERHLRPRPKKRKKQKKRAVTPPA
jgi:uncharacterized RDD family membrane protein YckC